MLELLWPSVCGGCETRGEGLLCPRCRPGRIHRVGLPIPGIRGVFTCAMFPGPTARALKVAKYTSKRPLAQALADGFATALAPTMRSGRIHAIVPVPSSATTRMSRGFSMPAVLAHQLAARAGVPVVDALSAKRGPRQAGLGARQRKTNAAGRIRGVGVIAHPVVLLVDDVVTTGATAEACARELLGAGAAEIWLATLCAARPRHDRPGFETRVQKL